MQWYSADCQAIHGTKAPQLWTMLTSAVCALIIMMQFVFMLCIRCCH